MAGFWCAINTLYATSPATEESETQTTTAKIGLHVDPPVILQKKLNARYFVSHTANEPKDNKPLECAGLAWAEGGLVILSDRHEHALFTSAVNLDAMSISDSKPHVVVPNAHGLLWDGESIVIRPRTGGGYVGYVLCSLSNDKDERPLPQRRHMMRFRFDSLENLHAALPTAADAAQGVVLDATPIRDAVHEVFKRFEVELYRTYSKDFAGENKNTYRWGNVEGMSLTPDGRALLCGMRNPLPKNKAVLFTLRDVDKAFDQRDASLMRVTDVFLLDLGGRGVSDLSWDPVTRGYLITAGRSNGLKLDDNKTFPPRSLDAALFWWSGRKSDQPKLVVKAPDLLLEAVCRLGKSRYIALGTDEGDVSEGRDARESRLIIMEFTGVDDSNN